MGKDGEAVEPLFAAIFEHSTDSIMLLDLDAKILFINRPAPGLTLADVLGRPVYAFVSEDQHDDMRRCFANVRDTGLPDRYNSVFSVVPDNLSCWESRVGPVKTGELVTGFVVFASDITARTTAAAERDRIFELSADLLCVVRNDGHFTRVNPAFVKTLGYTEHELLAKPFIDFVHPDDRASTIAVFRTLLEPQQPGLTAFENRYVRKDGATRLLQWSAMADLVSNRIIGVARDVTDSRALEAQLRHSQKMDAVGRLAGGVAHDFNNLLQAILGNLQFAMQSATPEMTGFLADIQSASLRATAVTKQLLSFSRKGTLDVVRVDLNLLVREFMQLWRRVIPSSITFDFIAGHQLAAVFVDRGQIEQVIMNLVLNARDAMPDGGRLTIETENILINGNYAETHPTAAPGRYVLLTVTDTGVGMTPEVRDRIFEPFFTTKGPSEGSGLGLAVAYGIVEQHNGILHVYSEVARGTTFKLYLPVIERLVTNVGTKLEVARSKGTETILVAEDDPLVRDVLIRALERVGYRVLVATNGGEAIKLFREHDEIALALVDIIMPELSGPEVYQRIQERRPGLPTLFVSGYSDASRTAHRIPESVPLLSKPFELDELLARVRSLLDKKSSSSV